MLLLLLSISWSSNTSDCLIVLCLCQSRDVSRLTCALYFHFRIFRHNCSGVPTWLHLVCVTTADNFLSEIDTSFAITFVGVHMHHHLPRPQCHHWLWPRCDHARLLLSSASSVVLTRLSFTLMMFPALTFVCLLPRLTFVLSIQYIWPSSNSKPNVRRRTLFYFV